MSLVRKEVIRPGALRPVERGRVPVLPPPHPRCGVRGYGERGLRADQHERFARWLERTAPERRPEVQAIVGYHFERALRFREELGRREDTRADLARKAASTREPGQPRARPSGRACGGQPPRSRCGCRPTRRRPSRPQLMIELVDALREQGEFDRVEQLTGEGATRPVPFGDRALELRFELRRLYLRVMGDPRNVLLGEIAAEAESIAIEAAAVGIR